VEGALSHQARVTMPLPQTHHAKSGELRIAYQVVGHSPFSLVFISGFISNGNDGEAEATTGFGDCDSAIPHVSGSPENACVCSCYRL